MKKRRLITYVVVAFLLFFIGDRLVNTLLMSGVKNYYGLNQKADVLLIGHSHLMLSVDKQKLEKETGLKVSKYCREGVNVSDKKAMVDHFLNSGCADSLKLVLYGVDLATFTGEGLSQNSYMLFYPFMDDDGIDKYVKSQATASDYWLHKFVKTYRFTSDDMKNSAARGWLSNWSNLKYNQMDVEAYKKRLRKGDERNIAMNPDLMKEFDVTIKTLTSKGIKVVLVNTPTYILLNQYEPEKYDKMMTWFKYYANQNKLVEFWDFNPRYAGDYTIFSDRLHLNQKGQSVITKELIDRINVRL